MLAYTTSPATMIALVAVLTCGLAVTSPTFAALIPEMVRRDELPRASAVNMTASSVGLLLGPALAGVLVGGFGSRPALLVDAASYLAITVAGLLIQTRRRPGAAARASADGTPAPARKAPGRSDQWRVRGDSLLRSLLLALAAVVASVTAINVVVVFFVRETLGASATTFGLVEAAWTGGMLTGAWVLARWLRRPRDDGALGVRTLVLLGGSCAAVLLGSAAPAAGWLLPIWFVGGMTNGATNTAVSVLIAQRVAPGLRGRA